MLGITLSYILMFSFLGAGLGCAFLAGATFEYRRQKSVQIFMLIMLMYVGWSFANLLVVYTPLLDDKLVFARTRFIFISMLPPLWLYFATELFKNVVPKSLLRWRAGVFIIPTVLLISCMIPSLQKFVIASYQPYAPFSIPIIRWSLGPMGIVHIWHSYLALVLVFWVCFKGVKKLKDKRRQYAYLLWFSLLSYIIPENIGIHVLPEIRFLGIPVLTQILSAVVFYYILNAQQVVKSFSQANDLIFELLPTAAVLLDKGNQIVMYNTRAAETFDLNFSHVGQSYDEALPSPIAKYMNPNSPTPGIIVPFKDRKGVKEFFFEITCEPFRHRVLDDQGKLILFKDVSDLKKSIEFNQKVLSLISHDLLGNLSSLSQLISNRSEKHWELMLDSSRSTVDLVKNILLWSTNQGGFYNVNKEKISIKTLTQKGLEQVRPLLLEKQIQITGSALSVNQTVDVDIKMFLAIYRNLLSNALRYSPKGSSIKVEFNVNDEGACLSFIDQGPGIEKDRIETILRRGDDVPWSPESQSEGYGLGLFLVMQFLKLHGGSLDISNAHHEWGCKVTARFPISTAPRIVDQSLSR